jgi:CRP-like cAMP-binding protein
VIYRKGDFAEEVYFILEGKVGYIFTSKNIKFKTMIAGSYFGEVEIIDHTPREFSTITEE